MPVDYESVNTESGALDMINRYRLERGSGAQTLLKKGTDYNGVDIDYKMEETALSDGTCTRVCALQRQNHIGYLNIMDQTNEYC